MWHREHAKFICGRYQDGVEIDVYNHHTLAIRTATYQEFSRPQQLIRLFSDIRVLAAMLGEFSEFPITERNVGSRRVSSEGSDSVSASVPFELGNPHVVIIGQPSMQRPWASRVFILPFSWYFSVGGSIFVMSSCRFTCFGQSSHAWNVSVNSGGNVDVTIFEV